LGIESRSVPNAGGARANRPGRSNDSHKLALALSSAARVVVRRSVAAMATTDDASRPRRLVAWLRNDLRIHDNIVLHDAAARVRRGEADEVLPVYVLDPGHFAVSRYGSIPKMGPYRAKFLLESLADLQQQLRALGSDLTVRVGRAEDVLPPLLDGAAPGGSGGGKKGGGSAVLTHEEVTSEEQREQARVERALGRARGGEGAASSVPPLSPPPKVVRLWGGATMYHPDDLPYAKDMGDLPDVFTQCEFCFWCCLFLFCAPSRRSAAAAATPAHVSAPLPPPLNTPVREKAERHSSVRPELPTPSKGDLPLPSPSSLPAGVLNAPLPTWRDLPWPAPLPVPDEPPIPPHPRAALPFKGGETAALARLKYYLWDSDRVATYFETRNGMLGGDYSTKFAPWLAHGCLSARRVHREIRAYERERTEGGKGTKNTYWVLFELTWRDFFVFWARKHGNKLFFLGGPSDGRRAGSGPAPIQWRDDPALFSRWAEGRTGLPLIDANMRELRQTGFMSNRGRQNVASVLALDYGLDWRLGAALFEYYLVDFTPSANWGNWVCAAGMNGGRVNRFNVAKQSKDYDPEGEYAKAWVPELARVPASRMHEPHLMSRADQEAASCEIGKDYPSPVPAAQLAWRGNGGDGGGGGGRGGRGGGGGRGGRGGGGGGGRGGGGRGARNGGGPPRRKSEFDMYG
jgi:deoxyribodipyrimidine photo-lyase